MAYSFTNKEIADLLRNASAAYAIKGGANLFQIRAYDSAAEAIDHATSDVKELWQEGQLDSIPGIGTHIQKYLEELFTNGKVKHFDEIAKGIPPETFKFLVVPGVGPKTALKLAEAKVTDLEDLEIKIKNGTLGKKGFSEKVLSRISQGLTEYEKKGSDRILLPVAYESAEFVLKYLKQFPPVKRADPLGSLRRMVSTIGDIDIAVASDKPQEVVDYFTKMKGISHVVEAGERTATISLHNRVRVDLMVQPLSHYGSLLQHFTGSKQHNIHLRELALKKGYSISEYGVKEVKSGKVIEIEEEKELYSLLGMQTPAPELRENTGEIEAALEHKLPKLIEPGELKGDLHTHSFWSDGRSSIKDMADAAKESGLEYIALTDHSYPNLDFKGRIIEIEQYNSYVSNFRVIYGLEVNINADSTMQVSDDILKMHQWNFGSIHTSFRQSKAEMTNRLIAAAEHPYIDVIAHPTGRLLLQREGIEADWEKVFKAVVANNKFLEIDAYPDRLDLVDTLIKEAKKFGVKFVIDSDSHHTTHLPNLRYGVSVARRGWLEAKDVVNTLNWSEFKPILESRRKH